MNSLPGAIVVLAGAILLAVSGFVREAYAPVNVVAGLMLCVLGFLSPLNAVGNDSIASSKWRIARLRFSIRDLLLLTLLAAVLVAWWLDHRSMQEQIINNFGGGGGGGGFGGGGGLGGGGF